MFCSTNPSPDQVLITSPKKQLTPPSPSQLPRLSANSCTQLTHLKFLLCCKAYTFPSHPKQRCGVQAQCLASGILYFSFDPMWIKAEKNHEFSGELDFKYIDHCGFGCRDLVILLEAHSGTNEQLSSVLPGGIFLSHWLNLVAFSKST